MAIIFGAIIKSHEYCKTVSCHTFSIDLPQSAKSRLVEMDIVNTPAIQELRAQGVSQQEQEGRASAHNRTRRGATVFDLWPGARIPYKIHYFISMSVD